MKKFTIIGNCQAYSLSECFKVLCAPESLSVTVTLSNVVSKDEESLIEELSGEDAVFVQEAWNTKNLVAALNEKQNVAVFPVVVFEAFHPDCVYLNGGKIKSPIGDYHSGYVWLSFKAGLTPKQCKEYFLSGTFQALDLYKDRSDCAETLKDQFINYDLPVEIVDRWSNGGAFMHSVNHPSLGFMSDFAKALLANLGIEYSDVNCEEYIPDPLLNGAVYPVLPQVAEVLGVRGNSLFRGVRDNEKFYLSMDDFIDASYELYSKIDQNVSVVGWSEDLTNSKVEILQNICFSGSKSPDVGHHPYRELDDMQFWRKAFPVGQAVDAVDPVQSSRIKIGKLESVATAGSCFAQHIANRLQRNGFNYFVAENPPDHLDSSEAKKEGYGVFSARYGNVYTTRQMRQLFEQAYGLKSYEVPEWRRGDGAWVDPFRPQISQRGFSSYEEVLNARRTHLECVKDVFCGSDYFVFTMGLTEAWVHTVDGGILPLAPGVAGGTFDAEEYRFHNFSYEEIKEDLTWLIEQLRAVNPGVKVILTVSPVPLAATYENRHVLVSTVSSKSILRAVADAAEREFEHVSYFPSYEIITGSFNSGDYFEADLRQVNDVGVSHVMRLFMKHCTRDLDLDPDSESDGASSVEDVVCDEEILGDV